MEADDAGAVDEVGAAGEHAAFARGQVLGRVEAEAAGVVALADPLVAVLRGQGVGRVFDQGQAMFGGEAAQRRHVAGVAAVVHGDDGPGARGDGRGDPGGVEVQGVRLDVHQDGAGADVLDHRDGRHEGERGGDHLVAGADAQDRQGRVQGRRAAIEREGGGALQAFCETLLELAALRARW